MGQFHTLLLKHRTIFTMSALQENFNMVIGGPAKRKKGLHFGNQSFPDCHTCCQCEVGYGTNTVCQLTVDCFSVGIVNVRHTRTQSVTLLVRTKAFNK